MPWVVALLVLLVVAGLVYWAGTRLWRGWDQLQDDARQAERRDRERAK